MFIELTQTTGTLKWKRILVNCEMACFEENVANESTKVYHNGHITHVVESYDRIKDSMRAHTYIDDFIEFNTVARSKNAGEGRIFVNYKGTTFTEVGKNNCRAYFLSSNVYIKELYTDVRAAIITKLK